MRQMSPLPKLMYSHCNEPRADARQQEGEFVRIPYAEMNLYPVPAGADEEALVMLSTFCPTGCECGIINGPAVRSQSLAGDRRREALGGVGRALRDLQSDRAVVALRNLLFGSAALASASALRFTTSQRSV